MQIHVLSGSWVWKGKLERSVGMKGRVPTGKPPLGPGAVVTPLHRSRAMPCAGGFSLSLPLLSVGAATTGSRVVARANLLGQSLWVAANLEGG